MPTTATDNTIEQKSTSAAQALKDGSQSRRELLVGIAATIWLGWKVKSWFGGSPEKTAQSLALAFYDEDSDTVLSMMEKGAMQPYTLAIFIASASASSDARGGVKKIEVVSSQTKGNQSRVWWRAHFRNGVSGDKIFFDLKQIDGKWKFSGIGPITARF